MSLHCKTCGAKCCKYFCFEIDEPESYEGFEDIRWYLMHGGVTVHVDEGDWYISIDNPCKMLNSDNQCTNYENRPLICRDYAHDNCDHSGGDYGYDEYFDSPESLDAYARKTLGDREYQIAGRKARAKAQRQAAKARKS